MIWQVSFLFNFCFPKALSPYQHMVTQSEEKSPVNSPYPTASEWQQRGETPSPPC